MTGLVETDAAFMTLNRGEIVARDGGWRMEEENLMSSSNVCRSSATGEACRQTDNCDYLSTSGEI
jgi:hypothetical protein